MLACLLIFSAALACGAAAPPAAPPGPSPPAHPCEEAYADLTKYFTADPERRRPPSLHEATFVDACHELPIEAQRCMLFSYMQAHANPCDKALNDAPPEIMRRLGAMAGK